MFSRWMVLERRSRGTSTSLRPLSTLRLPHAHQPFGVAARIPASVFMLHGMTIMPSVRNEPEEMVAA